MDRSAGGDGGLPDLAVTAEIESKSKARFVKPCESGGESPRIWAEGPLRIQRLRATVGVMNGRPIPGQSLQSHL
jgi:hypothetical protein